MGESTIYLGNTHTSARVVKYQRAPTSADTRYKLGTIWVNTDLGKTYICEKNVSGVAAWADLGAAGSSWQDAVIADDVAEAHAVSTEGNRYLCYTNGATWVQNNIYEYKSGEWECTTAVEGMAVYVKGADYIKYYTGSTWENLVGKATTDTLTNKSIDCNGTGNAITNVNVEEMEDATLPATHGANVMVMDGLIACCIKDSSTAFTIYDGNAPFAFTIIDAWSVSQSAGGGTWQLFDGAGGTGTAITDAVTVAASDKDVDRVGTIDAAVWKVPKDGTLSVAIDAGGNLDCVIFIKIAQLS